MEGFVMTSLQAKAKMKQYLKSHFIKYSEVIENGVSRYTILFEGYECCPDKVLEACVWFYPDYMECRVYYDCNAANWCRESEHRDELMRLLNYCNARVWPFAVDGMGSLLYQPNCFYTPRFYMTEDGCCDITMTTMIPLELYETAPLETEDYFTLTCPEILNKLSIPIFFVLLGKFTAEQAIMMVKTKVLGANEPA